MDTGVERELATHCQDPLEGSFCHNSANPLVVVKAEAIRSHSNYIEIKIPKPTQEASLWCRRSRAEGVSNHY
jgi:hypothetical protein